MRTAIPLLLLVFVLILGFGTEAKSGDEGYPNAPAREVDGLNRSVQVLQEEAKRSRTRDTNYQKQIKALEDRIALLEGLPTVKKELDAWRAAHPKPPERPEFAPPGRDRDGR